MSEQIGLNVGFRGCKGKQRHKSIGASHAALRSLERRDMDAAMQVYFCAVCPGWHVGHPRRGRA